MAKLPGLHLHQFAEGYFEQPGLEKIALPIIADLQREYSTGSPTRLKRFFILLRGYSGFWKAIILYSLFSDEGNIRIFKSTGFHCLLGVALGAIDSLFSWMGNQTPGVVSLFPNVLSALASLCLLSLAVWFCARQIQAHDFYRIWWVSVKIALPFPVILSLLQVLLMYRWFHSSPPMWMIAFGTISTVVIALVSCMTTTLLVWGVFAVSKKQSLRS